MNMVDINPVTSIITLNATIKDRFSEWIKKQDPTICCLQENTFNINMNIDEK